MSFAPFQSSRVLADRARDNLDQFDRHVRAFHEIKPYSFRRDLDPKTGETLLKVLLAAPPPAVLSAIAFDIACGLRAALDHAVFDCASVICRRTPGRATRFPIRHTAAEVRKAVAAFEAEVPVNIRRYLIELQPYEGGTKSLWELNQLRNRKVHEMLSAVILASRAARILPTGDLRLGPGGIMAVSEWDRAKGEFVYMRVAPDSDVQAQIEPILQIRFGEADLFGDQPCNYVFRHLLESVVEIVDSIERQTIRARP